MESVAIQRFVYNHRDHSFSTFAKLHVQGVRNVSLSENFANVLNE